MTERCLRRARIFSLSYSKQWLLLSTKEVPVHIYFCSILVTVKFCWYRKMWVTVFCSCLSCGYLQGIEIWYSSALVSSAQHIHDTCICMWKRFRYQNMWRSILLGLCTILKWSDSSTSCVTWLIYQSQEKKNKRSKDLGALPDSCSWDDLGNFLQTCIQKITTAN